MAATNAIEPTALKDRPEAPCDPVRYVAVPGRVLMSVIFLFSGIGKVIHFSMMAQMMAAKEMPAPRVLLAIAACAEIVGGLSLLLGLWARIGAFGLFVYLIPTTLLFHNFWAAAAADQMNQQAHFLKNVAIMGGLLMITALGAGPFSVDSARRRRR